MPTSPIYLLSLFRINCSSYLKFFKREEKRKEKKLKNLPSTLKSRNMYNTL